MSLPKDARRNLQSELTSAAPWTTASDIGPRAVDAGQCDRCDARPRLVPTCGPVAWRALCRDCALEVGLGAWCEGHAADGRDVLDRIAGLPGWWGDAVVLVWVATGEVGGVPRHLDPTLPASVRAALPQV